MNKPIPERVEPTLEEILEILPHLILGNAEALYNDPDGELAKNTISEMQRVVLRAHRTAITETDQQARDEEKESKDSAYRERNMLVCALTKLFPAYLARHDESDESWERDWMWIVYIDLPTGQVSWHIHDSEFTKFSHLEIKENNWDGHNTERKYQRLLALSTLSNPPSQV